jgi:hypothetical protein
MPIRDQNPRLNEENPWHMSVTTGSGQFAHPAIWDDFDEAVLKWLQRFGPEIGELALRSSPTVTEEEVEFQAAVDNWLQCYTPEGSNTDPGQLIGTITIEGRRGDEVRQVLRQVRLYQGAVALSVLGEQPSTRKPVPPDPVTLLLYDADDHVLQEQVLDENLDSLAVARDLLPGLQAERRVVRTPQAGQPAYFVARRGRLTLWAARIECHHAWAFVAPNHPLWTA